MWNRRLLPRVLSNVDGAREYIDQVAHEQSAAGGQVGECVLACLGQSDPDEADTVSVAPVSRLSSV